jgi:hypothetical protein
VQDDKIDVGFEAMPLLGSPLRRRREIRGPDGRNGILRLCSRDRENRKQSDQNEGEAANAPARNIRSLRTR